MYKIDELRLEIKSFEDEIAKLKQELNAASQVAPRMESGSAIDISNAYRVAAVATHERIADVQAIRGAIAELNSRLTQKQTQFEELQRERQKQERVKQVEIAKQQLRQHIEKVDNIASLLQSEFLALKVIYQQSNADFKALGSAEPGSYSYSIHQLIHFEFLKLPVLHEKDGSFILSSRIFDLFGPEQKAKQEEQAARSREWRENHEREMAEVKQKQIEQRSQIERQERKSLLINKQSELAEFQAARTERLSSLASANVNYFDDAIAKLKEEIETLDKIKQE
jgi:hypothetical protein